MTGYGEDWGSWKPHPSLASEWSEFANLTAEGPHNSVVSKLCGMLLNPSVSDGLGKLNHDKTDTGADKQLSVSITQTQEEYSQSSQPLTQIKSQGFPYLSETPEEHDVDSLLMELHEVLESHNIPLPDDLVSSLSELPQQAYPRLLRRLQEELTLEGLHTLCELACENIQGSLEQDNWLHPALVCKFVLLPKVMSEGECSNELCATLEEFARSCPKLIIAQILQPLLSNEESMNVQSDLLRSVTVALPVEHHLHLIKFVLEQCEAPLPVSKINVLITVLGATTCDLTVVLKKLMSLLEKSAISFVDNEQFSNLLLIIIRRLPPNTPQSVHDRLATIVRQNKSFNKQILLNALKEKTRD